MPRFCQDRTTNCHPRGSGRSPARSTVVPNLAVVELDAIPANAQDGDVYLYNGAGGVPAIIDVEGWFQ